MSCLLDHGDAENGVPRLQPTYVGLLCRRHRGRLDTLTGDIGTLWCELALILDGSAPRDSAPKTRHLKAAEAPAPLDLTAAALRDHRNNATPDGIPSVPAVVASWTLLLADERPLTATLPGSVIGQLALLALHHDWIAGQGWVDDYLREFEELHTALKAAVHDRESEIIGRCDMPTPTTPRCGGPLKVENGSSVIQCGRCHTAWVTSQEQARLAVRLP